MIIDTDKTAGTLLTLNISDKEREILLKAFAILRRQEQLEKDYLQEYTRLQNENNNQTTH